MPDTVRHVFKDPQLQKQFQRNGYVVVDLLDTSQTAYLRQQLQILAHGNTDGFFTTTWLKDAEVRLQTNRSMQAFFTPLLNRLLDRYRFFYGSYFIKNAGEQSDCNAHQDWTCTQEPRYTSVTVWCALQDMTTDNGCLRVMPCSHRLTNYIRGRHLTEYLGKVGTYIHTHYLQPIQMCEGQVVIFNQRLIHGSASNLTGQQRVACGVVGAPEESPLLHYVAGPGNTMRVLDASNDLFSRYDTFDTMENEPALYTLPAAQGQLGWSSLYMLKLKQYLPSL